MAKRRPQPSVHVFRTRPPKGCESTDRERYSEKPVLCGGEYKLVANRGNGFSVADWSDPAKPIFRKYTAEQKRLAGRGFHPHWWMPADLAVEWKGYIYPLDESAESVNQFSDLSRKLAEAQLDSWRSARENEVAYQQMLDDLQHNLAIIRRRNPKIVPSAPAVNAASSAPQSPSATGVFKPRTNAPAGAVIEWSTPAPLAEWASVFERGRNGMRDYLTRTTIYMQLSPNRWQVAKQNIPDKHHRKFFGAKAP